MSTNFHWQEPLPGGPMSLEEYLRLDNSMSGIKYEYIDGQARLMAGGTREHDQIAFNTRAAIDINFRSGPCFVQGEMRVLVADENDERQDYFYPDVVVSCNVADRRRGNTLLRSPRIVVEVLSPSTEILDRGVKLEAYKACPTIQEIVLIDQFVPHVEVYRRDTEDGNTWSHVFYGPEATVELKSVDTSITMHEIYDRIDFDEPLLPG